MDKKIVFLLFMVLLSISFISSLDIPSPPPTPGDGIYDTDSQDLILNEEIIVSNNRDLSVSKPSSLYVSFMRSLPWILGIVFILLIFFILFRLLQRYLNNKEQIKPMNRQKKNASLVFINGSLYGIFLMLFMFSSVNALLFSEVGEQLNYSSYGLATPKSPFTNELIFSVNPEKLSQLIANYNVKINVVGTNLIIWPSGYYLNQTNGNSIWTEFNLEGDFLVDSTGRNTGWLDGSAVKNLQIPKNEFVSGLNFFITYTCQRHNDQWKCGCNDISEENCDAWMIQIVNYTKPGESYGTGPLNISRGSFNCNSASAGGYFYNGSGTPASPYGICNVTMLQKVKQNLSANYVLLSDIDASETRTWNNGTGFESIFIRGCLNLPTCGLPGYPVCTCGPNVPFTGSFDGKGFFIDNIYIVGRDGSGVAFGDGLFGAIRNASLYNVNLRNAYLSARGNRIGTIVGGSEDSKIINSSSINASISAGSMAGGLIGSSSNTQVINSHFRGSLVGVNEAGGIIGRSTYGSLINSSFNGNLNAVSSVGGLIGYTWQNDIYNSTSRGVLNSSGDNVGGFVGQALGYPGGVIDSSSSYMSILGNNNVGGLIGRIDYREGSLSRSFYNGTVFGNNSVGGLIGSLGGSTVVAYISNCYAFANVSVKNQYSGGLVGQSYQKGSFSNSYFVGDGIKLRRAAGLIYWGYVPKNLYYNSEVITLPAYCSGEECGLPKTTLELKNIQTYLNDSWDFTSIWAIDSNKNQGYPYLRWQNL